MKKKLPREGEETDARIARVSCEQNELNANIQHFRFALEEKGKRKAGKTRNESNWKEKDRDNEREGKQQIMHSGNASNTPNLRSFI